MPSKKHHLSKIKWAQIIWSKDIPPSKSILVWRMMLDKLPTDEVLASRGCHLPSICSLCYVQEESIFHLFFQCQYAVHIWSWFASCLNWSLQFQSKEDMWSIINKCSSPQGKLVITAVMINIFNVIWFARNQSRFNNKKIHWRTSIANLISSTSLSGNNTLATSNSNLYDFAFIKKFNINLHPPRAPQIIEVIWHPPISNWFKCNSDGSSNSNTSGCGGIFRNHNSDFLLCFAENTGKEDAYFAEISGALRAIELAKQFSWNNLWLELHSMLVVNAFKNKALVPWRLKNRWENCMITVSNMNFIISHIYREGNQCVDHLANLGLSCNVPSIWMQIPNSLTSFFVQNKLGIPNFRFITH